MKALGTEAVMRWFAPRTIAGNVWCVRYARHNVESVRVEEWAAVWRAMAGLDCLENVGELDVPALVLAGMKDLSGILERMRLIAENVGKTARYVEVEGEMHMMVMEMAEAEAEGVAERLVDFRKGADEEVL